MKFALALVAFFALLSLAYALEENITPSGTMPPPPTGCYDDRDCAQGYICANGTCVPQLPYCGDGACNSGESCSSCPADCGGCGGGDGSGAHDAPPMHPQYPPLPQSAGNQSNLPDNQSQNISEEPGIPPLPEEGAALPQAEAQGIQNDKTMQREDIVAELLKKLNLGDFLGGLAAAIGQIPLPLALAIVGIFAIAGAAAAYYVFVKKKEEGG